MPFTTSDLRRIVSSTTIDRLSKMTIMNALVDRRWQREAQQTYEISVPVFDSQKAPDDTTGITELARGGNWPTPTEDDISEEKLAPDQQHAAARLVKWRDASEVPLNVVMQTSGILANQFDKAMDSDMFAQWVAGTPAAQISTLASSKTVSDKGADVGNVGKNVYSWLVELELTAYDTGWGPDSETPFMRWVVMPPAVFAAFREYVLEQDYADALNVQILRDGNILPPGAMRQARAYLNGTIVYVSSRVPKHTVSNGVFEWQIIGGTNRALTYITKPALSQVFTPQQNQVTEAPGWLFRSILPFGRKMIDDRMAHVMRIRQA